MADLDARQRRNVLAICCLSLLLVGMDITIVNVGLSAIKDDLHASLPDLQWTIDAYTVVLASFLILAGSTGDRLGRKRVFQIGLTVFTLGSLLCGLAPTLGWLIAFRVVQALGGSMMNPVALSIITNVFTEPRERARAIGAWAAVTGVSLGVGPVVGGALIDSVGWRAIFWINVPIGVVAVVLTAIFVPDSRAPRPRRPDPLGQVLVVVILAGLTFAIIESPRAGWLSVQTIGTLAAAAIAALVLARVEPRRADPLLEFRFFRSVPFSGATAIAVCAFASFSGFLFLVTLYLQDVRGLSPLAAGTCMLPFALTTLICAPLSGRMVGAHGPRVPLVLAGTLFFVGGLCLVPLSAHEPYVLVIASFMVFAAGFGLVNAPITNTAVSGMPREQAGVAAAVASTSRQVGATLGVAVVGSVLAGRLQGPLADGFVTAARGAWWIITGCGLAVLLLGLLTTGRRAVATVERAVVVGVPVG